jgi:hypothetical protein
MVVLWAGWAAGCDWVVLRAGGMAGFYLVAHLAGRVSDRVAGAMARVYLGVVSVLGLGSMFRFSMSSGRRLGLGVEIMAIGVRPSS